MSDEKGLASVSISDSETKQSGIYGVDVLGVNANFQVFPGLVDSLNRKLMQ